MWSSEVKRTMSMTLVVMAAVAAVMGCRGVEGRGGSAHIVAEMDGGRTARLPCTLLDCDVSSQLQSFRLAQFDEFPNGDSRFGLYRGLCGSPIIGSDGRLVGAVRLTYFSAPARVF